MAQPRIRQSPTTWSHFDDWPPDAINKVPACQDFMPAILPDCYCCLPFFDPNKITKWQKDLFLSVSKSVQCKTALDSSNKPVKRVDAIVTESAKHLQLATVELLSM